MKIVKIISTIVIIITLIILSSFKLINNKKEMSQEAKLAKLSAKNIPVKTQNVESKIIDKTISANGFMKAKTELPLISDTQGKIIEIYKEKGDFVNAGDLIAKVDDELFHAQLMVAQANYEKLKTDFETFSRLAEGDAITGYKLEEVKLAYKKAEADLITIKRRLSDTEIKAPISGRINNDYIEIGTFITAGTRICDIINIKELILPVFLSEQDIINLEENDNCDITISTYPNTSFKGEIITISDKAGQGNQYEAEIEVINPKGNPLKAGMYAEVHFINSNKQKSLVIDRKAIAGSIKEPKIFVVNNGQAIEKSIVIESIIDNMVIIKEGVNEGDQIITDGLINIRNNTKVEILN